MMDQYLQIHAFPLDWPRRRKFCELVTPHPSVSDAGPARSYAACRSTPKEGFPISRCPPDRSFPMTRACPACPTNARSVRCFHSVSTGETYVISRRIWRSVDFTSCNALAGQLCAGRGAVSVLGRGAGPALSGASFISVAVQRPAPGLDAAQPAYSHRHCWTAAAVAMALAEWLSGSPLDQTLWLTFADLAAVACGWVMMRRLPLRVRQMRSPHRCCTW